MSYYFTTTYLLTTVLKQERTLFHTHCLHPTVLVSFQLIMQCGDSAGPHLQEPDQGRERAAPACQWAVGQSWSASDQQCNQEMTQETVSLHCSWRRTCQTCTVNITALLRPLMQHACLIINNTVLCFLLCLNCLQRIYIVCATKVFNSRRKYTFKHTG